DYTTDASSFEAIERKYEEKKGKPFFAFCVTVQNHGGYWHQQTDVRLTNIVSDHANDYASLLKKTDDAFADLIEYFENVEEPTIIVMFGDHQPNIGSEFYEQIWKNDSYSDEELTYLKAKVPFIIWANYDIEEKQMGDMSINYLGPTVMETAGLPLSGYQTFVGGLREKVPVVSGIGFVDDSGRHFKDVSSSDYYSNLREYEFLQYNYLKGNSKDPFYE
ncbi:MAG: sulfatase-like hydrolase/transferase, partial [Lachnospiraceae bacterium]|nr:sulfatase-like hydrolase/transferase [Lachnospiraceae bacterium]